MAASDASLPPVGCPNGCCAPKSCARPYTPMSSAGSESLVALISSMRRSRSFSQLALIETRADERVGEQLDHEVLVARQVLAVDRERFGTGRDAEIAASAFDCIGEGKRIALASALLQQARDERRDAGNTFRRCAPRGCIATPGSPRVAGGAAAHDGLEGDQRHVAPRHDDQRGAIRAARCARAAEPARRRLEGLVNA